MSLLVDVVGILRADGVQAPIEGVRTRLRAGELILGSLPTRTPNLTLPSPNVSANHARIYLSDADGAWHIEDLDSTRGTWLLPAERIKDTTLTGTKTFALADLVLRITVAPDG